MQMRTRLKWTSVLVALGVSAVALTACDQKSSVGDWSKPAGKEWPMTGGDWANTRYTALKQINLDTVKDLGGAWMTKLDAAPRGTPVVVNGKMFVVTGQNAYALNPKTGEILWTQKLPAATYGLFKGVAAGEGMIFVGLGNAHVVALKQDTGEQVWDGVIGDEGATRGQFIAGGPTYVDGLVIGGLANGDYGIRGRVTALDAKTGKQAWVFYSVPGPGEPGHETWSQNNDEWKQGGGGAWAMPAVDKELGLVYFGIGNPVPQYGGELRRGDNLYTNSLVALDIKTGKPKWHYQVVHHDIWEADLGTPPIMYDATVEGKTVKSIAIASTNGFIYMLDRANGEPVFPIEEMPVPQDERQLTAPTQPFPVGADQFGNRCVDKDTIPAGFKALCMYDPVNYDTPNAMYPLLSTRAAPIAYNPETKRFYATAANWPSWLKRAEDPKFFAAGPTVPGMKYTGLLGAMDAATNKLVWKKTVPYRVQQNGSGMMATAGGLLFHAESDGVLQAINENTGDIVWTFQTGAANNSSTSFATASYEVDGEQYITLGTSGGGVWAFKLGGTVPPLPAPEQIVATETSFVGRVTETDEITMSPTVKDTGLEFVREAVDEYAFQPVRTKVKVGAKVTWTNKGKETHTATAIDGSWTTGEVAPGKSVTLTFDKPGTYTYQCKGHEWSYAQLIVEAVEE
jgi:quinohemoprotein ethanol dehydrogenase